MSDMSLSTFRNYKPAGPVAASFLMNTTSIVRAILGPVGGGKSSTCVFDLIANACRMPVCLDGTIRFKVAVIGQTYGQMERNLFPTWKRWLPADGANWTEAEFTGGGGRMATHKIEWDVIRDGKRVTVYFEAIFAALGEHVVEDFMRGFEPTAFWFYEVDLLPENCIQQAIFRLGRFPAVADLPPGATYRSFIICDLNAPDVDSWFYRLFEEDCPADFKLYKQPSGRSPQAENLHNLPPGYYDRQVAVLRDKSLIKRMIDAQYAPSADGQPVFPEYSDEIHFSPTILKPRSGVPLRIGMDAGLQQPAAVIGQWLPSGQWVILGEVVPGRTGARKFAEKLRNWLSMNAPGQPIEIAFSDPAGFDGADKESGEMAWAETVLHELIDLQFPIEPAPSNEIGLRLDAVRDELTYMIDGQTPSLLISQSCTVLRKALASHYCYRKQQVGSSTRFADKPDKTARPWADVADALQYLLLGSKGRAGVIYADTRRKPSEQGRDRGRGGSSSGTVVIKDGGW